MVAPAGAELDSDFRLRLESGPLHALHQTQPIVGRERDESARELDDVEPDGAARVDVLRHCVVTLGEHALDESAGRDKHTMLVAESYQLLKRPLGNQRERPARELQRVDPGAHCLQDVLQSPLSERRIVRSADFRNPACPWLWLPVVAPQEVESGRHRSLHCCFHDVFSSYQAASSAPDCAGVPRFPSNRVSSATVMCSRLSTALAISVSAGVSSARCAKRSELYHGILPRLRSRTEAWVIR